MPNIYIDKYMCSRSISMAQPHMHDHYEIQFLIKGYRIHFIDDTSYRVPPNSIIVIPPHVKHMTGGESFIRFNANIFPSILTDFQKRILDKFKIQQVMEIPEATMMEIVKYLEEIQNLPINEHFDDHAQSILSYVFYLIEKTITAQPTSTPEQMKAPLLIYKIIDYINEHLNEELSLEIIAHKHLCSVPYLRKLFQTYMHRPLYDYILGTRLGEAKRLLSSRSNYSITKVSEMCGFSSCNYFCAIFKKKEGISPLAYKKLHTV